MRDESLMMNCWFRELEDATFLHVLHLFCVSSPAKCGFENVHRVSALVLKRLLQGNPLAIDFSNWRVLQETFDLIKGENTNEEVSAFDLAIIR